MKNNKLFKSLSALALAGIMAFSSVSLVSAEETQATEDIIKVEIDGNISEKTIHTIKIVDVVHYSNGDSSQTRYVKGSIGYEDEMFASEGSHYSFSPIEFYDESIKPVTGKVEGVVGNEDITITFEYTSPNLRPGNASDSSGYGEHDYLLVNLYAKDAEGKSVDGIKVKADNCKSTGDCYTGFPGMMWVFSGPDQAFPECKTSNGAVGFVNNDFIYSALSYDVKYVIDDAGSPIDGMLDGNNCLELKNASNSNCTYTITDTENNKIADVVFSGDDVWRTGTSLIYEVKNLDSDWDVNVDAKCASEYDEIKSGNDIVEGLDEAEYANADSAIIANITVTLKPEKTEDVKEVTLTEDNKAISKDDMSTLITENATKDVVIKTPAGITLTFAKGTMKAVEGKETYDFGVSMSDDYSKHSNMGVVTKDNFVSLIDFNYSGNLPAEATVKIPVGADRAGQTLYYSQKVEAGYTLIQSVKVDNEGYITVKQDHCSTYVVTTTDVSKDASTDIIAGISETGDSNHVIMYAILFMVAGALLVVTAGSKIRKRA